VFNVGSTDENLRKKDLVEMLLARLPGTTVKRVAQAEDPRDYRVSFDKIRSRLAFSITKTVDEGMDEVLALLRSGAVEDPYSDAFRN
jgi:nucleoside-diphosphate-sugar epimerase